MNEKCRDCESENLLKVADLQCEYDRLKYYAKTLEKCLNVKEELCRLLRDRIDELKTQLEAERSRIK